MPTDAELLDRLRRTNDAAAFDELTRRYRGVVFASAQRVTGDRHDAEDVAQNCFLELARRATSVTTSVAAYLHTAATYRARNVIRDRARRRKHEQQAATGRSAQQSQQEVEPTWEQLAPEVDLAIEELPEDLRIPVIRYYLRGLTDQEIALEMGVSKGIVRRRLQVGVRRLRATLAKGGLSLSIGMLALSLRSAPAQAVPTSLKATLGRIALVGMGTGSTMLPRVVAKAFLPSWAFGLPAVAVLAFILVLVTLGASLWITRASKSAARLPYDRIQAAYESYMPSRFASRTAAMTQSSVMFWRGSQPMFFDWCKSHAADWLADPQAYVLCHASPHLPDGLTLPNEIDVANSARMPFQIELLQAMVALRVETGSADNAGRLDLDRVLFDAYRTSLSHPARRSHSRAVSVDAAEMARFVHSDGRLRAVVHSDSKNPSELVRAMDVTEMLVQSLVRAMQNNPQFGAGFAEPTEAWVREHLVSAGQRLHLNAAASQGLLSLLAVIRKFPLGGGGDYLLIELREIAPAAAALAGAVPLDDRPPGRRAAEDARALAAAALPVSWCEYDGKSMLVRLHEPPGSRPLSLKAIAHGWATETAATHRSAPNRDRILAALTPELLEHLSARADAYAAQLGTDWSDFRQDSRSLADFQATESEIASRLSAAYRAARHSDGKVR